MFLSKCVHGSAFHAGPLRDARLPKRTERQRQQQIHLLQTKLRQANKNASKQRRLVARLKGEVNTLHTNLVEAKTLKDTLENCPSGSFLLDQLKLFAHKKQGRRYSEHDKNFALALHYCSPSAYRMLQKMLCLPCERSLRSWLQALQVKEGLNDTVLKILGLKSQSLELADRVVSVIIDEISLKEHISYNAREDIFEGFAVDGRGVVIANQALVVMIKGLKRGKKQVLGYYLSKDGMRGDDLKEIVISCLHKIKSTGFAPKALVCDRGQNNVRMRKLLGVTRLHPYVEVDGEKTFFFHDVPHLIKAARNNLKKFDFAHGNRVFRWGDIVTLYEKDCVLKPRLAPRLRRKHLVLPPFSPMRVCLATQTLSYSVSRAMMTHVAFGTMDESALDTAEFIEKMDQLFDSFNSSRQSSPKKHKRPVSDASIHWAFWEEMECYLSRIRILNSRYKNPYCLDGWIDNINSIRMLWPELRDKFGFRYILTRRLTQDCIENLFSVVRYRGGNSSNPDPSHFRSNLRQIIMNNLTEPSEYGNSEGDMGEFLLKARDLRDTIWT
uniref:Putative transposase n=1 Tax=Ixodes ricinus TaxID=34613 RepID=A0A6B0VEJ3_IXORI